jgi:hypothetical protein
MRAAIEREGGQGIVRVELDPERKRGGPDDVRSAAAAILPPGDAATSTPQKLTLAWTGEDTLEARFPIQKTGIYLGAVDLGGGKTLPLAPLSLPYSPEFEPREDPEEGLRTMAEMARVTGGAERTAWNDVFNASRLRDRQVRDLIIPLVLMVLLLHVAEIAGRRLLLFAAAQARLRNVRLPKIRRPARVPAPAAEPAAAAPPAATSPAVPRPAVSPLARAKARARDRTSQ